MEDTPSTSQPIEPPSGAQAFPAAAAQPLVELIEIQKTQSHQIEELRRQNERMIGILANARPEGQLAHVKVEDVNMPFMALVGFLIKVSFASIPAMLVLTVIYGVISVIVLVVLSLLGYAIGNINF